MSLERKVRFIEGLFEQLDSEIFTFQNKSKLQCTSGCGQCCNTPSIEASPLEFLPLAFHLFLTGKAETTLKELNSKQHPSICNIYTPLNIVDYAAGQCSHYRYRGLICRLFGYAAARDKYGKQRLVTCKLIKENQLTIYQDTMEAISNGLYLPMFTDYYMQLAQIDFKLGNMIVPINKALKLAIEEVLQYYAYRPFPGGLDIVA